MPQFEPSADLSKECLFVRGYCKALLWANTLEVWIHDSCQHADPERTQDAEITRAALRQARADAKSFLHFLVVAPDDVELSAEWADYIDARDMEDAGHDFALSRNGHGAGFFDRDDGYPKLQAWAKTFGECTWILNSKGNAAPF